MGKKKKYKPSQYEIKHFLNSNFTVDIMHTQNMFCT